MLTELTLIRFFLQFVLVHRYKGWNDAIYTICSLKIYEKLTTKERIGKNKNYYYIIQSIFIIDGAIIINFGNFYICLHPDFGGFIKAKLLINKNGCLSHK